MKDTMTVTSFEGTQHQCAMRMMIIEELDKALKSGQEFTVVICIKTQKEPHDFPTAEASSGFLPKPQT